MFADMRWLFDSSSGEADWGGFRQGSKYKPSHSQLRFYRHDECFAMLCGVGFF